jgi:enoyl-CoA hydratase
MTESTFILEQKGRMALLTLNRPQALNAINMQMNDEVAAALKEIDQDKNIDVLIITGAGEKAFCAGRDLKEMAVSERRPGVRTVSVIIQLRELEKPTIAAVNGYAVTGGFELALSCDIIIASENAKFADTHARVGLIPGGGMSQLLPRLVGIKKAKEISFTGNFMSSEEALRLGLVNKVVPIHELLPTAEKMAEDIIGCQQWVVREMKSLIDKGEGLTLENALRLEHYTQLCNLHRTGPDAVRKTTNEVFKRGRDQA